MISEDKDIELRFNNIAKSKTFQNLCSSLGLKERAVFDIGCSYGEFLCHFGEGSMGLTIAPDEAEYGKKVSLDIRVGNIEEGFPISEKFEVIFANNLFEHLYSPHGFLIKLKDFTSTDGVLVLGVPCVPKIVTLMSLSKFRGALAVSHINFFTRQTLKKTVERGGWKVHAVRSFHFKNRFLDSLANFVSPHFYVIATMDPSFEYHEKRKKELAGYTL